MSFQKQILEKTSNTLLNYGVLPVLNMVYRLYTRVRSPRESVTDAVTVYPIGAAQMPCTNSNLRYLYYFSVFCIRRLRRSNSIPVDVAQLQYSNSIDYRIMQYDAV